MQHTKYDTNGLHVSAYEAIMKPLLRTFKGHLTLQ